MPYVAPGTVAAGDVYTAAAHNIQVNNVINHETRITASGLSIVTPTSVSGSGITLSGSKIIFTAAASGVFINGAFTSTYDNYLVLANFTGNAAVTSVTMQFAVAGVASTTNYATQRLYSVSTTISSLANENGTDEVFFAYLSDATSYSSTRMEIFSPALTQGTTMISTVTYASSPVVSTVSAVHTTATSYDGLKIIHSGALTGTMRIYGYTNV